MVAPIPTNAPAVTMYPDGRMDTKNTSAYTGLAEKTLAMKRSDGTGPKFVKRGRVFYFQADVDAWMNAQGRHTSTAQARCSRGQAPHGLGNEDAGDAGGEDAGDAGGEDAAATNRGRQRGQRG